MESYKKVNGKEDKFSQKSLLKEYIKKNNAVKIQQSVKDDLLGTENAIIFIFDDDNEFITNYIFIKTSNAVTNIIKNIVLSILIKKSKKKFIAILKKQHQIVQKYLESITDVNIIIKLIKISPESCGYNKLSNKFCCQFLSNYKIKNILKIINLFFNFGGKVMHDFFTLRVHTKNTQNFLEMIVSNMSNKYSNSTHIDNYDAIPIDKYSYIFKHVLSLFKHKYKNYLTFQSNYNYILHQMQFNKKYHNMVFNKKYTSKINPNFCQITNNTKTSLITTSMINHNYDFVIFLINIFSETIDFGKKICLGNLRNRKNSKHKNIKFISVIIKGLKKNIECSEKTKNNYCNDDCDNYDDYDDDDDDDNNNDDDKNNFLLFNNISKNVIKNHLYSCCLDDNDYDLIIKDSLLDYFIENNPSFVKNNLNHFIKRSIYFKSIPTIMKFSKLMNDNIPPKYEYIMLSLKYNNNNVLKYLLPKINLDSAENKDEYCVCISICFNNAILSNNKNISLIIDKYVQCVNYKPLLMNFRYEVFDEMCKNNVKEIEYLIDNIYNTDHFILKNNKNNYCFNYGMNCFVVKNNYYGYGYNDYHDSDNSCDSESEYESDSGLDLNLNLDNCHDNDHTVLFSLCKYKIETDLIIKFINKMDDKCCPWRLVNNETALARASINSNHELVMFLIEKFGEKCHPKKIEKNKTTSKVGKKGGCKKK